VILMRDTTTSHNSLGVNAFEGALVKVERSRLRSNNYAGARAIDHGTIMELTHCQVEDNTSLGIVSERNACIVVHRDCNVIENGMVHGLWMNPDGSTAGLNDLVPAGGLMLNETTFAPLGEVMWGQRKRRYQVVQTLLSACLDRLCHRYGVMDSDLAPVALADAAVGPTYGA